MDDGNRRRLEDGDSPSDERLLQSRNQISVDPGQDRRLVGDQGDPAAHATKEVNEFGTSDPAVDHDQVLRPFSQLAGEARCQDPPSGRLDVRQGD
jgi:hypothetical protein